MFHLQIIDEHGNSVSACSIALMSLVTQFQDNNGLPFNRRAESHDGDSSEEEWKAGKAEP